MKGRRRTLYYYSIVLRFLLCLLFDFIDISPCCFEKEVIETKTFVIKLKLYTGHWPDSCDFICMWLPVLICFWNAI